MKGVVNRILFISLSNIGDAVMTTPVLRTLHELYPEAVIDIVGDQRSSEIFKNCPFRGEIYHKQKKRFLRGLPGLVKELWFQSYDVIVDIRTDGLAYLLTAGKRYSKFNRPATGPHAVQQHMGIISKIYQGTPPQCHIWTGDADGRFAEEALGDHYGKKLLGIGSGANAEVKIWPKENYLSLVEKAGDKFDAIVFIGDSRDKERSDFICARIERPCINLCGKTNILQAVAIQKCLKGFVGNDSGLGHMASAAGIPTITIFGIGEPYRYRPWGEKSFWLLGEKQNIQAVSVDDVVELMQKQGMSN
jgi:lipopolysaccharide heptosyltransferase III